MYFGWISTGFTIRSNDKIASRLTTAANPNAKCSHPWERPQGYITADSDSRTRQCSAAVFAEISLFREENIDFTSSFVVLEQPATAIQRIGILPRGQFSGCSSKRQRYSQELLIKSRINKKLHAIHHIENQWGYTFCTERCCLRQSDHSYCDIRWSRCFGDFLWAGRIGLTKVLFLVLKML